VHWTTVADLSAAYFVTKNIDRSAAQLKRDRDASLSQIITDSVADGLYVIDCDGSILYVNQSGLRMLGHEADELIGRDAPRRAVS
jgi:PAS domain-containing protein